MIPLPTLIVFPYGWSPMTAGETHETGNGETPGGLPTTTVCEKPPAPGIGLCLSGGGYRAMLFHVGALWRLNEVGLLSKLDRISSVSGGSITAGVLGMNWTQLKFDRSGMGQGFVPALVDPIRQLASHTIDWKAVVIGLFYLGDRRSGGRSGVCKTGLWGPHLARPAGSAAFRY